RHLPPFPTRRSSDLFARAVSEAGLMLVGPPAAAIEAMGNKSTAKALMAEAGVPLVPGYHGADQSPQAFVEAARQIGYPVLLKARDRKSTRLNSSHVK